ncbi:hypothetical protein [Myxococcus eversor]|uniref:hypothetical protein n=1 Tax=Myxococcus eversor TaxID=2709661 RepID=UPI0013D7F86A|nr:hypothetical protein [Myxococcus eversor]
MSPSHPRRPPIVWSVVQEHLDEAAFFWRQRQRTLRAPDHDLSELADGEERRLLAHIAGLHAGGTMVAERLLVPQLEAEDVWVRTVATYALLTLDVARWGHRVLQHLEQAPAEEQLLQAQALTLCASTEIDGLLREALPGAEPEFQAVLLETLRLRRNDVSFFLARLPPPESPELLAAAIRAARHSPDAVVATWVGHGLRASNARCRNAALEVGLVRGCIPPTARALDGTPGRTPLTALAMCGDKKSVERLLVRAREPATRSEALWALAHSGRSEAIEAALGHVRASADALAAEAFRLMTGIPLETYLTPLEEEDAAEPEAPLEPKDEGLPDASFLPGPVLPEGQVRADAVDRWWHQERSRFASGGRYIWGRPWTPTTALQALLEVPMTRRPGLAWELAVRSGGTCWIETQAWARTQRQQVRAFLPRPMGFGSSSFEVWAGGNAH